MSSPSAAAAATSRNGHAGNGSSGMGLDFRDLPNHCGSTYESLSYIVEVIVMSPSHDLSTLSDSDMDRILQLLEDQQVDLSQLADFPYDHQAPDVEETLLLLAQLQNRASLGDTDQGDRAPTVKEITEYMLMDRSKKLATGTHRYDIGEWVEVRGPSMQWRMEIINNILRNADNEVIYETSVDTKLSEQDIRWPREALRRVFGMGPWAWRQWAMLKLEDKLCFKRGHPHDFELLDIMGYAEELWDLWINDRRNAEFQKLFDRVGKSGQEELIRHILSPFELMAEVIHDEDKWDFADAGISIYTYVSLLGSGFIDAILVVGLQAAMPIILFAFYTSDRDIDEVAAGTRGMLVLILIYYLYKVVRDSASQFHELTGVASSTLSRIQSLRTKLWERGTDSFAQSIGYTVDLFMNTGYINYLYIFNIWILYNVSDPFELLGSVIFFEFLFGLDEEIASSRWWDTRTKRFIRAGVVQIIMQISIQREYCQSRTKYFDKFSAHYTAEERQRLDNSFVNTGLDEIGFLQRDDKICCGNRNGPDEQSKLLTTKERVERLRRNEYIKLRSVQRGSDPFLQMKRFLSRLSQSNDVVYGKPRPVRFAGVFCCGGAGSSDCPIFERHKNLRVWSQWEKLIFLFPTPTVVPTNYRAGSKLILNDAIGRQRVLLKERGYVPGTTRRWQFISHVCEVLSCKYSVNSCQAAPGDIPWSFYFTRVVHGFYAWQSYVLQIVFPVTVLVAVLLVYYDNGYCSLRLGDDGCALDGYYSISELFSGSQAESEEVIPLE